MIEVGLNARIPPPPRLSPPALSAHSVAIWALGLGNLICEKNGNCCHCENGGEYEPSAFHGKISFFLIE